MCNSSIHPYVVVVLALGLAGAVSAGDPSLVGWWRFDEGSGTIAYDSSGNNRHATIYGNPKWVAVRSGQALEFDGVNDYVDTGKTASQLGIGGNAARTVTAWVYTRSFNSGAIFDVGAHQIGREFGLRTLEADGQWRVQYWGTDAYDIDFSYNARDWWVHFAHVYDGSATRVHANGILVAESDGVLLDTADVETFKIGFYYGWFWDGLIDDVRLYNRALSDVEVPIIAKAGDPRPVGCPPADMTGNCRVDFADFAAFVSQWLTGDGIPDEMVSIPAGTFQMGDSFSEGELDERPVHTVKLDSFSMGKYEVTNGQYCQYLNSALEQGLITVTSGAVYKAGSGTSYLYCYTSTISSESQIAYGGGIFSVRTKIGRSMSNDPVVLVTWYGAAAYCNWRSQQEGREQCYNLSTWACDFNKHGYRLSTEAQWEYAARGGLSDKRFPWGDMITHSQGNYHSTSSYSYDVSPTRGYHPTWSGDGAYPFTSPVGTFSANGYGLYDMPGNVWEWCNDWYSGTYYSSSPQSNPTGPSSGSYRVIRGGSWYYFANYCRVAYRDYFNPSSRGSHIGFRLVLDLE